MSDSRFPFESQIVSMPSEHQYVIRNLWHTVSDAQDSIPILKKQIESLKTSTPSSSAPSTTNVTNNSETVSPTTSNVASNVIGYVNSQAGNTSYTTVPSDYGDEIVLNSSSPIAVTLSTLGSGSGIQLPWFCTFNNIGTGTATLTPASGTIAYPGNPSSASMPLSGGNFAIVYYDGTNFSALIGSNSTSVGTITGVTAGTGLTGGGSSGNVTLALSTPVSVANGGTGTATPGLVAGSNVIITGTWPNQTIAATGGGGGGYVKGTISIGPQGEAGTYTASGTVTGATVGSVVAVGVVNSAEGALLSNLIGWVATANTVTIQVTSNAGFLSLGLPVVVFI